VSSSHQCVSAVSNVTDETWMVYVPLRRERVSLSVELKVTIWTGRPFLGDR
jgi:hypothetical protein